ncbi:MAG: hypothetical protein ABR518_03350 [Actinomycetota bacterium]
MLAASSTAGLFEWMFVIVPLTLFGAVVVGLWGAGRPRPGTPPWLSPAQRISSSLERLLPFPSWATATVGVGLFALLVAVIGFYWDVGWHIDFGRDKELFTPPHTMILIGLATILAAGVTEVVFATVTAAPTRLRWRSMRVPWSALPVLAIGAGALAGFPLDEVWHRAYGIDVTMWSPSHLLMIGGASLVPAALWLVLVEAGIRPTRRSVGGALHFIMAGAVLTGLSTMQGEFDFGVPQFQLLYHPVLIMLAAGIGLVTGRLVLGPGGALETVLSFLLLRGLIALVVGPVLGHTFPHIPLYVGSAVAVEVAAALVRTDRLGRFALAAGLGIGTVGLVEAWGWSHVWAAYPWRASLLPAAALIGPVAALGGAVIGGWFGRHLAGARPVLPRAALAAAGVAFVLALAVPFPRTHGRVVGTLAVDRAGSEARVRLDVVPGSAAEHARWFDVLSWQGGTLIRTPLRETGPGSYAAERPVPASGSWKTLVRLHRGTEMVALPVYMPADPSIDATRIPAADRTTPFVRDTELLLRESKPGPTWPALLVYIAVAGIAAVWIVLLGLAATKLPSSQTVTQVRPVAGQAAGGVRANR